MKSKPWKDRLMVTVVMLSIFAILGLAVLLCMFLVGLSFQNFE